MAKENATAEGAESAERKVSADGSPRSIGHCNLRTA